MKYNTDTIFVKKNEDSTTQKDSKEIRVVVHTPKNMHERIKQQKINRIYDILNHEVSY